MKVKCNECKDIIEGNKNDIVYCNCRKCSLDETKYYTKISGYFTEVKENK